MMYFLLILFFSSLFGITFMIGRKLIMLPNMEVLNKEDIVLEAEYLEEIKHVTIKNIKKISYSGLVATIRLYFRSSNFIKNKYSEIKIKIKNIRNKNKKHIMEEEKREISKFLKIISEYKQKIREIKHKIKEEEGL